MKSPPYLSGRSRNVDPGLGEEGARTEHEDDVDDAVQGIFQHMREGLGRRQVVAQTLTRKLEGNLI